MIHHKEISKEELHQKIRQKEICFGGNKKLKIYGTLHCQSGKRMKKENRIFFISVKEALQLGYRPCGHCMKSNYQTWKNTQPNFKNKQTTRNLQLTKMDLFNTKPVTNLLPQDGVAIYYGKLLKQQQAQFYFDKLLNTIEWKNDEAIIFGKHITTKRKVAWYADRNYAYTYSNTTKEALPWTKELLELKAMVETITNTKFNSCLLNLYHNGDEGMAWHSDDEKSLGKNTAIASLSLGAVRKFSLKHKQTKQTISILLESGSLLVMKGTTQTHWLHSLPKTKQATTPRVNLTFRTMVM